MSLWRIWSLASSRVPAARKGGFGLDRELFFQLEIMQLFILGDKI